MTLIFVIRKFRDNTSLEEDKTIILLPSKRKSDHYSLRNRENETHKFAGGLVREGGCYASLVVGVTRAVYERARPKIYAFRFRDYEGCSGPILIFFVSFDSYCPQLSKSVF